MVGMVGTFGFRSGGRHGARPGRLASVAAGLAVTVGVTIAVAPVAGAQDDAPVTLTVGLLQDLASPNVTAGYLVSDYEVWNLQYATLTEKGLDLEVEPGLAESWTSSDDGLTHTYTLRDGLSWSDGTALTADDVVWTIETSRDQEWFNHFSLTAELSAVALDDRTVEITTAVPDPRLPGFDAYILPRHVWEPFAADDVTAHDGLDGVGSGPFTLQAWRSGQDWTMVANPSFHGGAPAVDRIVFRVFTNADAMVAALQAGEIDAAHSVPAGSFATLDADEQIVAVEGEQGTFAELAMNGGEGGLGDGHPALADLTVRQAIHHAIDKDVLVDRVRLGLATAGTTIRVSPDPVWHPELTDEERFAFDPDRARSLLEEAGYVDTDGDGVREMPDGSQPLEFRYAERSEGDTAGPIREFVTGWLADVGIATTVEVLDDTQLYERQIAGEYDLFVWGWSPFADPGTLLSYFTCDQVTRDLEAEGYNDANWCDPEFDELYARQAVELDRDTRIGLVHEMLRLFHERSTYVVLLEEPDLQAYRTDRFEGWTRQPSEVGPVMFSISSPSYAALTPVEGGADDGGLGTGAIIAIVVGAVVVLGGLGLVLARSRAGRDDRE